MKLKLDLAHFYPGAKQELFIILTMRLLFTEKHLRLLTRENAL